jgi:hypothetical protein
MVRASSQFVASNAVLTSEVSSFSEKERGESSSVDVARMAGKLEPKMMKIAAEMSTRCMT